MGENSIAIIHFVGVGGIGISALARYFLSQGAKVSGSDLESSELTDNLIREGLSFYAGHAATNIPRGTSRVIYSAAVRRMNPELQAARALGYKIQSYAQALGELTKKYETIAVSGSHGKSTTTALIGLILIEAGLNPTVIVGTKLREFSGKNFRRGESRHLVLEADEWNKSFHHYFPKIAVVTNIDNEHLDTYKTFSGVVAGFRRYLKNLKKGDTLVANYGDRSIRTLAKSVAKRGVNVIFYNRGRFPRHHLGIPGTFNQVNAEAAWQAWRVIANNANVTRNNAKKIAEKVFSNYRGSWRRFEKLNVECDMGHGIEGKTSCISCRLSHVALYSDYAHHPTEIKATLKAFRERYPKKRVVCVFQPHQQDRLTRLFADFVHAFDAADTLILLPAYQVVGREEKSGKDSFALVQEIRRRKTEAFYAADVASALKLLNHGIDSSSVIVFMGAGDMDSQVRKILGASISIKNVIEYKHEPR